MGTEEELAFERTLFDDPQLTADVELAMVLRDTLLAGSVTELVPKPATTAAPAPASARRPAAWLQLAAGVALGALGMSWLGGGAPKQALVPEVAYLTLETLRGAPASRTIEVASNGLLVVELPASDSANAVDLQSPDGSTRRVNATRDDGFLRIALNAPVASGDYVIRSGAQSYPFKVAPPAR